MQKYIKVRLVRPLFASAARTKSSSHKSSLPGGQSPNTRSNASRLFSIQHRQLVNNSIHHVIGQNQRAGRSKVRDEGLGRSAGQ